MKSATELEARKYYTPDLTWDERNQVLLDRIEYFKSKDFDGNAAYSRAIEEFRTIKHIYVENQSDIVGNCSVCKKVIFHSVNSQNFPPLMFTKTPPPLVHFL